jgi:hypothetical protein
MLGRLEAIHSDVALIHLGTNDLGCGQAPAGAASELESVITGLQAGSHDITVAQNIPCSDQSGTRCSEGLTALNGAPASFGSLSIQESSVVVVDTATGFDLDGIRDRRHSIDTGDEFIASHWMEAPQEAGVFRLDRTPLTSAPGMEVAATHTLRKQGSPGMYRPTDAVGSRGMRVGDSGQNDPGRVAETPGAILFVRYAYPPNERGYCGPPEHQTLFEYGTSGVVDPGLIELAPAFEGAWPYLQFIAASAGIPDPLDRRVVEAYWIGNDLLDRIDFKLFGHSLLDRFRPRAGSNWGYLAEAIPTGIVPNHAFHVFGIYPWVGLLGSEHGDHPLRILDRCRIRWGRVVSAGGDEVAVESKPLQWDGRSLRLAPSTTETVVRAVAGAGFVDRLEPGDWVSLHWNWVCDRLDDRKLANLKLFNTRQLEITNHRLAHPGPARVLG